MAEKERAKQPAHRDLVPRFAALEEISDRQNKLWYSSQAASTLLHSLVVATLVQTGFTTAVYLSRYGTGYQFGQAVLLASPLFELADRNSIRGKQQTIPLSALRPVEALYAPDLRLLNLRPALPPAGQPGLLTEDEKPPQSLDPSPSTLSIPFSGGGGALPSGTAQARPGSGTLMPFDMVPPSNSRARKPGELQALRIVIGDANAFGGGAREGLRLPASPERVGSSADVIVDAAAGPAMEEYLRVFLTRFRRACFDLLPDKRDLGAPGLAVFSVTVDRAGRIVKRTVAAGSGNAEIDRLANLALNQMPAYQPLPQNVLDAHVVATIRIRYRGR